MSSEEGEREDDRHRRKLREQFLDIGGSWGSRTAREFHESLTKVITEAWPRKLLKTVERARLVIHQLEPLS